MGQFALSRVGSAGVDDWIARREPVVDGEVNVQLDYDNMKAGISLLGAFKPNLL